MPSTEYTRTLTIQDFVTRITDHEIFGASDSIVISSDFQRGDEETGVWSRSNKRKLIDSISKEIPIGNITLVKDHDREQPWKVLDGGNRSRAIRDFCLDEFTDNNNNKFSQYDAQRKANFKTRNIQISWVTILPTDPPDIITIIYIRLNILGNTLSQGELIKGHGHQSNVPEIEMAKRIIQDSWTSRNYDPRITELRTNWINSIGDIGETKRCDSIAMMCGFIISAKTSRFENFRNEYSKLHPKFTNPYAPQDEPEDENNMTPEKELNIINKLNNFIDIMRQIPESSLGRIKKGFYPKKFISPIWKRICEGTMTDEFRDKLIAFYNAIDQNHDLKQRYDHVFNSNGNANDMRGASGALLTNRLLSFIENWDNQ